MQRASATFSAARRQLVKPGVNTRTAAASATLLRTMCSAPVDPKVRKENSQLHVEHDAKQHKFYIPLENGDEGVLEYSMNKGVARLLHTGVPEAYRGHGIAKLLAVAALDHFTSQATPMRLECTYLQRHAQLYPQPDHQKFILPD